MKEPEGKAISPLNPKREIFCLEYIKDLNATQASIRAGYSPKGANTQAAKLLAVPAVAARIQELMTKRAELLGVEADSVLLELLAIARSDISEIFDAEGNLRPIHEIPEQARRAIAGIEVLEVYQGEGEKRKLIGNTKKVKFWDKVKALELLARHLKIIEGEEKGPVNITLVNINHG